MAKSPKTPDTSTPQNFEPAPADGIDPNVVVPKAVRDAALRAEAVYQQPPAEPPAEPQVTPPAAPVNAAPPAPVVPQPPAQPQPPADWEHRYNSMKGRFDASQAEMQNMQALVSSLSSELAQATAMIEQFRNAPPPEPPAPRKSSLTEEDRQQFGDLLPVIQRAAEDMIAPQLEALKRENAHLKQRLGNNSNATVKASLDSQVPNWTQINVDPQFKAWLRLPDIYSGQIRQQMLNAAIAAGDPSRVVAFFKGFLSETSGSVVTPPPAEPAAPVPPAPRKAAVALETLAAPGRGGPAGADVPVPVDKPVFTRKDIADFYRDVGLGKYVGHDDRKQAMENAIQLAQLEGRVRGAIPVGQMGVLK